MCNSPRQLRLTLSMLLVILYSGILIQPVFTDFWHRLQHLHDGGHRHFHLQDHQHGQYSHHHHGILGKLLRLVKEGASEPLHMPANIRLDKTQPHVLSAGVSTVSAPESALQFPDYPSCIKDQYEPTPLTPPPNSSLTHILH